MARVGPDDLEASLARERAPITMRKSNTSRTNLRKMSNISNISASASFVQPADKKELLEKIITADDFKKSRNEREFHEEPEPGLHDFQKTAETIKQQIEVGGSNEAKYKRDLVQNHANQKMMERLDKDLERQKKQIADAQKLQEEGGRASKWILWSFAAVIFLIIYLINASFKKLNEGQAGP